MHSKIFQVSRDPLTRDDWVSEFHYYDNFVGRIADYLERIGDGKGRRSCIEDLSMHNGIIANPISETLTIKSKIEFFRGYYEDFKNAVDNLREISIYDFSDSSFMLSMDMYRLNAAVSNEFNYYIEDTDGCDLVTLQDFVRTHKDGDRFYIGAIIDYHF